VQPGQIPVSFRTRYKTLLYVTEGSHSFASTYFFTYFLFKLRDTYGFTDWGNLLVGVVYGAVFSGCAWIGGRLGQSRGFYWALRAGFLGMAAGLCIGWVWNSLAGLLLGGAVWTAAMCLTWANLEALVSVGESESDLPNRVGLYNVVWAGTAGVAVLWGGWLLKTLGATSLFWFPAAVHAAQWIATKPMRGLHEKFMATAPKVSTEHVSEGDAAHAACFQRLAWVSNAAGYMAINTLVVLSPGITGRLGLDTATGGAVMSWWLHARTAGFAVLWAWKGWHYNIRWFSSAYLVMAVALWVILSGASLAAVAGGQVVLGLCLALFYYSSLYYAMDGSKTHGVHGGTHEALLGLGIMGGPAVAALGTVVAGQGGPAGGLGLALAAGGAGMIGIWRRAFAGREARER
jgi:hypothetical protein